MNTINSQHIKRRKEYRLTQKQLAALVGDSTPTINRFERQDKIISLESDFAILVQHGILINLHINKPKVNQ